MTLEKYKILQAAWIALCVALIGGGLGYLLNWQIGLLAGVVTAIFVWGMLAGEVDFGGDIEGNNRLLLPGNLGNPDPTDLLFHPANSELPGNIYNHSENNAGKWDIS